MDNPGPPDQPDRSDDDPSAGVLTPFTCPECGGSLWEHDENGFVRFKCHVGHAYSPEALEAGQGQAVEMALWAALRNLQERAEFYRRLSRRSGGDRFRGKARDADGHADVLRRLVMSIGRQDAEPAEAVEGRPAPAWTSRPSTTRSAVSSSTSSRVAGSTSPATRGQASSAASRSASTRRGWRATPITRTTSR